MFRAMSWGDRQMVAAVHDAHAARAEALPLMSHVLAAEEVWLSRLEGRDARLPVWPVLSVGDCRRIAAENESGYAAFLARIDEGQLSTILHYQNQTGRSFDTSIIDILTHVVIHGAYHRGQIAKILGRLGAASPNTDFITFAREIEP
jgi:uncharacterized damage-inducible protein DinB